MKKKQPLAHRIRPTTIDEVIGQPHLIGEKKLLTRMLEEQTLMSMILYGPPGSGKTTIAHALANQLQLPSRFFNAVTDNKKDLTTLFAESDYYDNIVLIVDEVHRLNKDKQDLLLPYIETGKIILIGATTANPFFSINPAIRSRCHLVEIKALDALAMITVMQRALTHPDGITKPYRLNQTILPTLASMANGDVRYALNMLELLTTTAASMDISLADFHQILPYANMAMDRNSDNYYDTLSAFQKSIRGSDVDAALYYLARLLQANDLESIERRLLVIAYEDIGLANPAAVARTIQAIDVAKRVGLPEGRIPLANAIIDLSLSPKSKSAEYAIDAAMQEIKEHSDPIPEYLHQTPVNLMEEDTYDFGLPQSWHQIQYLPDACKDKQFYHPQDSSVYEKTLAANCQKLRQTPRTNQLAALKKRIRNRSL